MKYSVKVHIAAFAILAALFAPGFVLAANANDYNMLSPLPYVTRDGTSSVTSPKEYIEGIIKLAIGIAGVLAVLKIVIAGFQYITTENFTGKSNAKEGIKTAVIGLLLAVAAYTILATINPNLVNFTINVETVGTTTGLSDTHTCSVNEKGECVTPTSSSYCTGDGKKEIRDGKEICVEPIADGETCRGTKEGSTCITDPRTTTFDEGAFKGIKVPGYFGEPWANIEKYSNYGDGIKDGDARTSLTKAGIEINNQNCAFIGSVSCTSLEGIGNKALSAITALQQECKNCNIVITGGTEYWLHGNRDTDLLRTISEGRTKHYPGGNVMDLRLSSDLQSFLESKATKDNGDNCVRNANSYARYKYKGNLYIDENIKGNPRHFHVCFY
jgi:hypothetical protein